jgi:hypothetical protein
LAGVSPEQEEAEVKARGALCLRLQKAAIPVLEEKPQSTMLFEFGAPASDPSHESVGTEYKAMQQYTNLIKAYVAVDTRGDCILPKSTFRPKHFNLITGSIDDRATRTQVLLHLNDALEKIKDLGCLIFIR